MRFYSPRLMRPEWYMDGMKLRSRILPWPVCWTCTMDAVLSTSTINKIQKRGYDYAVSAQQFQATGIDTPARIGRMIISMGEQAAFNENTNPRLLTRCNWLRFMTKDLRRIQLLSEHGITTYMSSATAEYIMGYFRGNMCGFAAQDEADERSDDEQIADIERQIDERGASNWYMYGASRTKIVKYKYASLGIYSLADLNDDKLNRLEPGLTRDELGRRLKFMYEDALRASPDYLRNKLRMSASLPDDLQLVDVRRSRMICGDESYSWWSLYRKEGTVPFEPSDNAWRKRFKADDSFDMMADGDSPSSTHSA